MTEFPRVGDVFAGHRIEALIGRGGMGVVYLGEHLRLGRKVAVKVLSSELAQDALFRERFLREARAAATLDHPNIVSVYDAGEVGDIAYFSMQYIEGADLAAILRQQGALEPADAVAILREVASALDAAQAEGFVHRDVKPANILLQRERSESRPRRAYLSDFGITKRLEADGGTTGQFLGTIDYMAPEQITGGTIDGRTDQYSLACVLFQCLTGRVPFPRDDQVGVMYAHLQETPPAVARLRPGAPPAVDDVLRRAMSKPREGRFPTCAEFAAAAAEALGVPLPARAAAVPDDDRTPRAEPEAPVARRGPRRLLLGVAVAIVAGAVVSAVVLWGRGPAPGAGGHPTGEPSAATSPSPGPTGTRSPESTPTPFPAGFSWMRVPDPGHLLDGADDQTMNRAVSAASKVVAVGYEGSIDSDAAVWVSSDGVTWDRAFIPSGAGPGTQTMAAIEYDGRGFVAVGTVTGPADDEDGAVWRWPPGRNWYRDREGVGAFGWPGNQEIRRIIRVPGGLIAIGWDDSLGLGRDAAVWRFDGTSWSRTLPASGTGPGDQEMWNVATFGRDLIAVGSDSRHGDKDAAVWRFDGAQEQWSRVAESTFRLRESQVLKSVVAAGPGLVAVGSDTGGLGTDAAVWTSVDGKTWERQDVDGFRRPALQEMNGAIVIGRGVVAVGADGVDAGVWTSPDGMEWTVSSDPGLSSPGGERMKGVVMLNGVLVAVGHATREGDGNAAVWVGTPIPTSSPGSPATG